MSSCFLGKAFLRSIAVAMVGKNNEVINNRCHFLTLNNFIKKKKAYDIGKGR